MKNIVEFIDHELHLGKKTALALNSNEVPHGIKMTFLQTLKLRFIVQVPGQRKIAQTNQHIGHPAKCGKDYGYPFLHHEGRYYLNDRLDSIRGSNGRASKF